MSQRISTSSKARVRVARGAIALAVAMAVGATQLVGCGEDEASSAPPPSRTGLFVSDLHFNPLDDEAIADRLAQAPAARWDSIFATSTKTACSPYERDTNFPLLQSVLSAMRQQVPNPDIIFVSGDLLVHEFQILYNLMVTNPSPAGYAAFVNTTEQYVALKLSQTFPHAQIVPTLGDWDSANGNTSSYAAPEFLAAYASSWNAAVNRHGGAPDFLNTFSTGGYYSTPLPIDPRGRLIVLYTQPWAAECANGCAPGTGSLGDVELGWLSAQLEDARRHGQRVWLLGHIPPGISAAETLQNISKGATCATAVAPFWADGFSSQLYPLFANYRDMLTFGIFAHEHAEDYRIARNESGDLILGVKLVPSVTPIEKSNPAFVQFTYDPNAGVITDAKTWYLTNLSSAPTADTGVWELEYDFNSTYREPALDSDGVAGVVTTILTEPNDQSAYTTFFPSSNPAGDPAGGFVPFLPYGCALNNVTVADYAACYCGS